MNHINIPMEFASREEQNILKAWPFFGGTTPTPEAGPGTTEDPENKPNSTPGGNTSTEEDPIKKLQSDPNALQQLLQQVSKTSADLANVSKERDTLAQEKDKAARAQLTKEENLQKDLEAAQAQVEVYHEVVINVSKQMEFLNAAGAAGIQFNSLRQAMAELDDNNYKIDVDVDNRQAVIDGIDNEVKRIAKENPWLVKNAANNDDQNNGGQRRPGRPAGTGAPPTPPRGNQGGKQQRRDGLMNRFPVLMQGR